MGSPAPETVESIVCQQCGTTMQLKMQLTKIVGPGFVWIFECARCGRLDYLGNAEQNLKHPSDGTGG